MGNAPSELFRPTGTVASGAGTATLDRPELEEEVLLDEGDFDPPTDDVPTEPDDGPESDTDYGPAILVSFSFLASGQHSAIDVWKKAHELIQSANSKGLALLSGEVTDYSPGDENA